MVFSVVLAQKYSGEVHHWLEFLCRLMEPFCMELGVTMTDKEKVL
jgi:hypothetical protein